MISPTEALVEAVLYLYSRLGIGSCKGICKPGAPSAATMAVSSVAFGSCACGRQTEEVRQ